MEEQYIHIQLSAAEIKCKFLIDKVFLQATLWTISCNGFIFNVSVKQADILASVLFSVLSAAIKFKNNQNGLAQITRSFSVDYFAKKLIEAV